MSLNLIPLPVVEVLDPRVDLNNKRSYAILKGGNEVTYQQYASTSFNDSNIQITANPPSRKHIINRKPMLAMSFNLTFTGIPPIGQRVIQPNYDAPRAYPIATVTNTIQSGLENCNVSANLNQYWTALSRYYNWKKQREFDYSTTPSMLDQFQQYVDWLDPFRGGGAKNALGSYGINSDEGGRGGFVGLNITSNPVQAGLGVVTATATLIVVEPLFLSPFLFDGDDKSGLTGIQATNLTMTLGNLSRVWSHDATSPVVGFNVAATLAGAPFAPTLLMNFITPNILEPVPSALSWDYFEIVSYPFTDTAVLANGASRVLTLNSVTLKTIPRRAYIFARRRDADLTFNTTDTFAVINNLNMTFNNRVGLFSTASAQDLYEMSQKNGCNLSWSAFNRYVGSVICVEFGTDLALAANEAPGLTGAYQIGVTVNITNPALMENMSPAPPANPITYQLMLVVVNEGTISILNGSVQTMVGVFSQGDILAAQSGAKRIPYKRLKSIYGGDFFSTIADIGKSIVSGVKKGVSAVSPFITPALNVAEQFVPPQYRAAFATGRKIIGKGGAYSGGRAVSRAALRKRMA